MTASYNLTLVEVNTQEEIVVNIESDSALHAQRIAEGEYAGHRVIRIMRGVEGATGASSALSEDA